MRNSKATYAISGFILGILVDKYFLGEACLRENTERDRSESVSSDLRISIDGDSFEMGLKRDQEFYLPWSWIKRYFDVYGSFNEAKGQFEFRNSYSNATYLGDKTYTSTSAFMNFGNYNVENRERVKVLCGKTGVPISTQWSIEGYYYPIQISQFGLAAYSKNKTDTNPQIIETLRGLKSCKSQDKGFSFSGSDCGLEINPKQQTMTNLQICFDSLSPLSSIKVRVKAYVGNGLTLKTLNLIYIAGDTPDVPQILFESAKNLIEIGVGERKPDSCITRHILLDIFKGLGYRARKTVKKVKVKFKNIEQIVFNGTGIVKSATLANKRYETNFQNAAIWLRDNQRKDGSWPIEVEKELEGYPTLESGWVSAMAQGHGISMMVRAAQVTADASYWTAAQRALAPFKKLTHEGGVRNNIMGIYPWFEEYPFTEGHFVLNGFIYALIGLYDLSSARDAPTELGNESRKLFHEGLSSLKEMLPLYDAGKGSVYDLTHYVKKRAPNLARWDYHTVHIQQLRLLNSFLHDDQISEFATRWGGYLKADYADHN